MVKYALMITKYDLHDYAQTIFEKIISSYTKKLPIWFTYIDMMIKNEQIEIARSLFERLVVIDFPLKKFKSIFQKYLEFENKHGDSTNVSKVKMMAKKMLKNVNADIDE
jgi:Suppressor of forked protein (Suf)